VIHESIQTPDEYETRYLVKEMMKVLFPEKKEHDTGLVPEDVV